MKHDDVTEFKAKLEEFFGRPVNIAISIHEVGDEEAVEFLASKVSRLTRKPAERCLSDSYWWARSGNPFGGGVGIEVFGSGPVPKGWAEAVAVEEV